MIITKNISYGFFLLLATSCINAYPKPKNANFQTTLYKQAIKKFIDAHSKNKNITISIAPHKAPKTKTCYDVKYNKITIDEQFIKPYHPALPGIILHEVGHANDPKLTYYKKLQHNKTTRYGSYIGAYIGLIIILNLCQKNNRLFNNPFLTIGLFCITTTLFQKIGALIGSFINAQGYLKPREIFADIYAAKHCATKQEGIELIDFLKNYEASLYKKMKIPTWLSFFLCSICSSPLIDIFITGHPLPNTRECIIKKTLAKRSFTKKNKSLWQFIIEEDQSP